MSGKGFKEVYPPREDTFLVIDSLVKDIELIRAEKPAIVVEMWTGSGAIMASLLHHLDYVPYALAIDLSETAASLAKRTFIENNV